MAKQYAVIGLGRFGTEVAMWLSEHHFPLLAVDKNRSLVEAIANDVDNALCFDSTSETALRDARVDEMDVVVCAIGDHHVQNSILTTALLRQIEVPKIVARASTDLHARILRIVGATDVVNPEKEMGVRTAQTIATPGLTELISLAEGAAIAELNVPPSFVGKNMIDLRIRSRYGVNVIGIRRPHPEAKTGKPPVEGEEQPKAFLLTLPPEEPFRHDDVLVVAGTEEDVKKIASLE